MRLPLSVQLRTSLAALGPLWSSLGPVGTLRAGLALIVGHLRGEPWRGLPEPDGDAERLSRLQIRDAVLLYRHLRRRHEAEHALALLRPALVRAAVVFVSWALAGLDRSLLDSTPPPERPARARDLAARFFNATSRVELRGEVGLDLVVERCRFVELCALVGHPELAPLFCQGDLEFFATGPLALDRPTTLAAGGPECLFHLDWRR
jgi:hypothetical protein